VKAERYCERKCLFVGLRQTAVGESAQCQMQWRVTFTSNFNLMAKRMMRKRKLL